VNIIVFLLIAAPLLEIMVLIRMGEAFGFWNTLFLLIGIAVFGSFLAKIEGMRAWLNVQLALEKGEMPAEHMMDALFIFVAGIFFVLPGFLSDVFAIGLLIPWTRFLFKRWLRKKFDDAFQKSQTQGDSFQYRFLIR